MVNLSLDGSARRRPCFAPGYLTSLSLRTFVVKNC